MIGRKPKNKKKNQKSLKKRVVQPKASPNSLKEKEVTIPYIVCPASGRNRPRISTEICQRTCSTKENCTEFTTEIKKNLGLKNLLESIAKEKEEIDKKTKGGIRTPSTRNKRERKQSGPTTKWEHKTSSQAGVIDILFIEEKPIEEITKEISDRFELEINKARSRVRNHLYHLQQKHGVDIPKTKKINNSF